MPEPIAVLVAPALPSPARAREAERAALRVAGVQHRWHPDPDEHRDTLAEGVRLAADAGAELVCLPELTLSPYFAIDPGGPATAGVDAEPVPGGPTTAFATELATRHGVFVQASLFEALPPDAAAGAGPPGYNTSICVAPDGRLVARTRKLHLPVTEGYFEDRYFRHGDTGYPVVDVGPGHVGFPTCWDQWFPELSRAYALGGADLLVYPTAIGSEPDFPDFDTMPLWRSVIVGQAIASGLFMIVVNRFGPEGVLRFYGSSFISDPYGRILVEAPRDEPAVLVADLDLDARRDWLELFPFLATRRPDTYDALTQR